jgi:hypothetical protein
LRYLGIQNVSSDYRIDTEDAKRIGKDSFNLQSIESQDFGMINHISPMYLVNNTGEGDIFYIKTPLDHKPYSNGKLGDSKRRNITYSPFSNYSPKVAVANGDSVSERIFPYDYTAKDGLADSWLKLGATEKNGGIVPSDEIFRTTTRTIIDKVQQNKAFAKKAKIVMVDPDHPNAKLPWSFAFFADVKDGFRISSKTVYIGQGKSAFSASITKDPDASTIETEICARIKRVFEKRSNPLGFGFVYALSDIYLDPIRFQSVSSFYDKYCAYAAVQTRELRVFATDYSNVPHLKRYQKGKELIRLILAGSIFIVNDKAAFHEKIKNPYTEIAGFNNII